MKKLQLLPLIMLVTMIYLTFWFVTGAMICESTNKFEHNQLLDGFGLTMCSLLLLCNQIYGTQLMVDIYQLWRTA